MKQRVSISVSAAKGGGHIAAVRSVSVRERILRFLLGGKEKLKSTNPNRKAFNEFTGFIKCGYCGENYRSQQTTYSDGKKERYWRCAGICGNEAIKDSTMKKLTASVLGLDTFNEEKMDESLEKAVVLNGEITFHFKDDHFLTVWQRSPISSIDFPAHRGWMG